MVRYFQVGIQSEAGLCMIRNSLPKPHITSPDCSSIRGNEEGVNDGIGRLQNRKEEQKLSPNTS